MPLDIFRGWVEEVHPDGLWVRGTHTNEGVEFSGELLRDKLPPDEFAKAKPGSYYVLKVRTDRTGRPRKVTFRIVEKYWTRDELKKARREAAKLKDLFASVLEDGQWQYPTG